MVTGVLHAGLYGTCVLPSTLGTSAGGSKCTLGARIGEASTGDRDNLRKPGLTLGKGTRCGPCLLALVDGIGRCGTRLDDVRFGVCCNAIVGFVGASSCGIFCDLSFFDKIATSLNACFIASPFKTVGILFFVGCCRM